MPIEMPSQKELIMNDLRMSFFNKLSVCEHYMSDNVLLFFLKKRKVQRHEGTKYIHFVPSHLYNFLKKTI